MLTRSRPIDENVCQIWCLCRFLGLQKTRVPRLAAAHKRLLHSSFSSPHSWRTGVRAPFCQKRKSASHRYKLYASIEIRCQTCTSRPSHVRSIPVIYRDRREAIVRPRHAVRNACRNPRPCQRASSTGPLRRSGFKLFVRITLSTDSRRKQVRWLLFSPSAALPVCIYQFQKFEQEMISPFPLTVMSQAMRVTAMSTSRLTAGFLCMAGQSREVSFA